MTRFSQVWRVGWFFLFGCGDAAMSLLRPVGLNRTLSHSRAGGMLLELGRDDIGP